MSDENNIDLPEATGGQDADQLTNARPEAGDTQDGPLSAAESTSPSETAAPPSPSPSESKSLADRPLVRFGVNLFMVVTVVIMLLLFGQRTLANRNGVQPTLDPAAEIAELVEESQDQDNPAPASPDSLAPLATPSNLLFAGIHRKTELKTTIPPRERVEVLTYTVQTGDTLFKIADAFGIKPETVLWGNFEILEDNPHFLAPNQVLNILPTNGTYYQWQDGDSLNGVADFFQVGPEKILEYPGNAIDLTEVTSGTFGIEPGDWLIIPDGKRAIKDWGPPAISRKNPASARYYGEGSCGSVYEGAYGTGTFIWPTTDRSISGYNYSGIHPAIDIGGALGNPVYASDSGVVVFAGWSNYGYGYMVVIDHGNGFQTAYAHLSAVAVGCGQSVFQGGYIGALGSTGNSSGPHLHFELVYNGAKPNPLDYLR